MRERDDARAALTSLQGQFKHGSNGHVASATTMEISEPATKEVSKPSSSAVAASLEPEITEALNAKFKDLSSSRKNRKVSPTVETKENLSSFEQLSQHSVHKSDKPGVTCISVRQSGSEIVIASGGVDKQIILTDNSDGKVISRITGHSKKITAVSFSPDVTQNVLFSSSADGHVKVNRTDTNNRTDTYIRCVSMICCHWLCFVKYFYYYY